MPIAAYVPSITSHRILTASQVVNHSTPKPHHLFSWTIPGAKYCKLGYLEADTKVYQKPWKAEGRNIIGQRKKVSCASGPNKPLILWWAAHPFVLYQLEMSESLHNFFQSLDVGYPGNGSLQKSLKYLTAGRYVLTASLNCEAGPSLKKDLQVPLPV